ncbi:MAG: hypothetical protein VKL58_00780 [Cyanobacteriota bacterium]|nr:hypothetical protein [Cyanobacteriota bacterium]
MRLSFPFWVSPALLLAMALACLDIHGIAQAQIRPVRGGAGGPASGAGVMPGAGFGQAGPGLVNPAGPVPAAGGVGGPASGAGVMPGAGFGQAGPGLVNPAGPVPAAGGVGGPASGAGVMPGAGFGRPGVGR